jgi:hypothetical protein
LTITRLASRELEKAVDRIRAGVDALMPVTDLREALLHRDQGEISGFSRVNLVPVERR